MDIYVNVYMDMNPLTNKPFYVGVGTDERCKILKRNKFHRIIVDGLPNKKFERQILYKNILLDEAYKIEIQLIQQYGRICNSSGILANIHPGGPLEMNKRGTVHWLKDKRLIDILGKELSKEIIQKQVKSRSEAIKERHRLYGLSEKEQQRYIDLSIRRKAGILTEAEKASIDNRKNRLQAGRYTNAELKSYKQCSERQLGKTMIERLDDPNWVNPKEGKSMVEITGNINYKPWNKGKTMEELNGDNYIFPTSKSFKLFCNNQEVGIYKCERDFIEKTNLNSPTLCKLKRLGQHTIKRQKNSTHLFKTGDILTFEWLLK